MAKHKKDLETLFRESEHKLSERPSLQSWRKLERKLNTQRARRTISPYRFMSIAAALVALIAVIWVFGSIISNPANGDEQASVDLNFEIEDLVSNDESIYNRDHVSEYMAKFASQKSQSAINEGQKEKALVSKKNRDI
ncbi:hypothetical protein OAF63_02340 [Saprospiraceae bacterium]|jgi:hypothetical protein|nr:hypothetical protein [Bacteroidota bacterium]MDB4727604.1 hypothetical protein [Saprospiraceae bacterium]MDF1867247.1 hypothetical protein [Saprospiraceae bacterium]